MRDIGFHAVVAGLGVAPHGHARRRLPRRIDRTDHIIRHQPDRARDLELLDDQIVMDMALSLRHACTGVLSARHLVLLEYRSSATSPESINRVAKIVMIEMAHSGRSPDSFAAPSTLPYLVGIASAESTIAWKMLKRWRSLGFAAYAHASACVDRDPILPGRYEDVIRKLTIVAADADAFRGGS